MSVFPSSFWKDGILPNRRALCLAQLDPERRADARLAVSKGELAAVVYLDDTLGETETEPPAAFLRGESGPEHFLAIGHVDPLARVSDIDVDEILSLRKGDRDPAGTILDRIQSVFDQVLDNPFEELAVDLDGDGRFLLE